MFGYLALSRSQFHTLPEEVMPEKIEKASSLLAELAQLIRKSEMNTEDKKAARQMMSQVILNIYQREGKDEWAELQEIE
jgi:hypothetical protein